MNSSRGFVLMDALIALLALSMISSAIAVLFHTNTRVAFRIERDLAALELALQCIQGRSKSDLPRSAHTDLKLTRERQTEPLLPSRNGLNFNKITTICVVSWNVDGAQTRRLLEVADIEKTSG